MSYRNGIYVAFHAGGTTDPTDEASDIKYYNLLKAWDRDDNRDFSFVDSHEKNAAVKDSSKKTTLEDRLKYRLNNSKALLLITGPNTRKDTDWVPFEIEYALDTCGIPVLVAYIGESVVLSVSPLRHLWPEALTSRIDDEGTKTLHLPFREKPLTHAVDNYGVNSPPGGNIRVFTKATYRKWGLLE